MTLCSNKPISSPSPSRAFELLQIVAHPVRFQVIWLLDQYDALPARLLAQHLQVEPGHLLVYLQQMQQMGLLLSHQQRKQVYYRLMDQALGEIVRLVLER